MQKPVAYAHQLAATAAARTARAVVQSSIFKRTSLDLVQPGYNRLQIMSKQVSFSAFSLLHLLIFPADLELCCMTSAAVPGGYQLFDAVRCGAPAGFQVHPVSNSV